LTWFTNHRLTVQLGRITRKIVPEMNYNVSSGTLNPTIPIPILTKTESIKPNLC